MQVQAHTHTHTHAQISKHTVTHEATHTHTHTHTNKPTNSVYSTDVRSALSDVYLRLQKLIILILLPKQTSARSANKKQIR